MAVGIRAAVVDVAVPAPESMTEDVSDLLAPSRLRHWNARPNMEALPAHLQRYHWLLCVPNLNVGAAGGVGPVRRFVVVVVLEEQVLAVDVEHPWGHPMGGSAREWCE